MRRLLRPSGRTVLVSVGAFVMLLLVSNVVATLFWQSTGGVGILDLDGGANLFQPEVAQPFPPKGSAARVLAILADYEAPARLAHMITLFSLDLVFPAAIAVMSWVTIVWAGSGGGRSAPLWFRIIAGILAITYLAFDWGENLLELALLAGVRGSAVELLPVISATKMTVFGIVAAAMAVALVARALIDVVARVRQRRGEDVEIAS